MNRLISIDALRGFVMVVMLIDHIRETFYLHLQVSDPVDVFVTSPELFSQLRFIFQQNGLQNTNKPTKILLGLNIFKD